MEPYSINHHYKSINTTGEGRSERKPEPNPTHSVRFGGQALRNHHVLLSTHYKKHQFLISGALALPPIRLNAMEDDQHSAPEAREKHQCTSGIAEQY